MADKNSIIFLKQLLNKKRKLHKHKPIATKIQRYIAFQADDLDKEIQNAKILFGSYNPLEGYRVAMIEEQGVPIELVETR